MRPVAVVAAVILSLAGLLIFGEPTRSAATGARSISGTVYFDTDKDGQRDAGESPAPGRTVWLSGDEVKSNAEGRYHFDDVPSDASLMLGIRTDEQTECVTGDMQGMGVEEGRMLVATPVTPGVEKDLGVLPMGDGLVTGTLTNDLNENGVRDAGEPSLEGWKVALPGTTLGIICYSEVVTDSKGEFQFAANLSNYVYWLQVAPPPSDGGPWVWTAPTVATWQGDFPDSREPADKVGAGSRLDIEMHLVSGSASLAGSVFRDLDSDGVRDDGEPLLDCLYIQGGMQLSRRIPNVGLLDIWVRPTCTNGEFELTGLGAGTYHLGISSRHSLPEGDRPGPGQWLTVAEGQRIESIAIALCPASECAQPPATPVPVQTVTPGVLIVMPATGSPPARGSDLPRVAGALLSVGLALLAGGAVLGRSRREARRTE